MDDRDVTVEDVREAIGWMANLGDVWPQHEAIANKTIVLLNRLLRESLKAQAAEAALHKLEKGPTPNEILEGVDHIVARIVADVRGAFATSRDERPVFARSIDVEEVVRFVALRCASSLQAAEAEIALATAKTDEEG